MPRGRGKGRKGPTVPMLEAQTNAIRMLVTGTPLPKVLRFMFRAGRIDGMQDIVRMCPHLRFRV